MEAIERLRYEGNMCRMDGAVEPQELQARVIKRHVEGQQVC